jgi:predicted dehydrogenase
VTTKELLELVAVARKAGVVTGVGLNFRFALAVQRFREVIRNPVFGDLVHVQIMHAANKPRAPMWEADSAIRSFMLAQAIHSVDLALDLAGAVEKVDVVVREKNRSSLIQVDVTHTGGVTSSLLSGRAFPAFSYEMLAVGSQGHMLRLENFWDLTLLTEGRQGPLIGDGKRWREAWHPSPLESGYVRSGYFGELQAFVDAIQKEQRFVADYESLIPTYQIIDSVVNAGQRSTEKTRATASGEVARA